MPGSHLFAGLKAINVGLSPVSIAITPKRPRDRDRPAVTGSGLTAECGAGWLAGPLAVGALEVHGVA